MQIRVIEAGSDDVVRICKALVSNAEGLHRVPWACIGLKFVTTPWTTETRLLASAAASEA
jgi:hypothetical protein